MDARKLAFAAVASTHLLGCPAEDGDGSPACEDFAPCGGDPTGTWHAAEGCAWSGTFDLDVDPAPCHGLPATVEQSYSGKVTYAGNVETSEMSYSFSQLVTVPRECLDALGFDCDRLTDWSIGQVGIDGDWLECMPSAGGCECTAGFGEWDLYGEEEVSFVNGEIVYASGEYDPVPYCVNGGRLGLSRVGPFFFER